MLGFKGFGSIQMIIYLLSVRLVVGVSQPTNE